jgi:hypothetical protein
MRRTVSLDEHGIALWHQPPDDRVIRFLMSGEVAAALRSPLPLVAGPIVAALTRLVSQQRTNRLAGADSVFDIILKTVIFYLM